MRDVSKANKYLAMVFDEHFGRRHADGTICKARRREDCPFEVKAEKADADVDSRKKDGERSRVDGDNGAGDPPSIENDMRNVYFKFIREGFSDSFIKEVDAVDDKVANGLARPLRMPSESMKAGAGVEMPRWARSLYHLMAYRKMCSPALKLNDADFVKGYCQARRKWCDDIGMFCKERFGEPFGSGYESECYDANDSVIKTFDTKALDSYVERGVLHALERIMLGNFLFPESKYDTLAFGRFEKGGCDAFGMLLRQRKFDIKRDGVDMDKIVRYIDTHTYTKDGMVCNIDMNEANATETTDGNVVVVDPGCEFNADKYDFRNPPKRILGF